MALCVHLGTDSTSTSANLKNDPVMNSVSTVLRIAFAAFLFVSWNSAAENKVRVQLVSEVESVQPGSSIRVGVWFQIPERAHIYWRNPGSSGLAGGIEWDLADGIEAGPLQWPNPKSFKTPGLDEFSFGYEHEVLLFANLTFAENFSTRSDLSISANAYWLVCLDDGQCIPEDLQLQLTLRADETSVYSKARPLFERNSARVPRLASELEPMPTISFSGTETPEVSVSIPEPWHVDAASGSKSPAFYPDQGGAWLLQDPENGAPQTGHISFQPMDLPQDATGGALTLPIRNPITGATRVLYVEAPNPQER